MSPRVTYDNKKTIGWGSETRVANTNISQNALAPEKPTISLLDRGVGQGGEYPGVLFFHLDVRKVTKVRIES